MHLPAAVVAASGLRAMLAHDEIEAEHAEMVEVLPALPVQVAPDVFVMRGKHESVGEHDRASRTVRRGTADRNAKAEVSVRAPPASAPWIAKSPLRSAFAVSRGTILAGGECKYGLHALAPKARSRAISLRFPIVTSFASATKQ